MKENTLIEDGQIYKENDEVWDLGSFVAVNVENKKRHYHGLSKDINKLPHYVDSGSSAFCLDTGDEYRYHKPTDTWYKITSNQTSSGNGSSGTVGVTNYNDLNNKPMINGVTLSGDLSTQDLGINEFSGKYEDLEGIPETLPNPHSMKINGIVPTSIYDGSKDVEITIPDAEILNEAAGSPVGEIISFMGNEAPANYLICDGSEYNISEYTDLADHFIKEFGQVNFFGGDGETTFAVPDLRGEFLRGSGTATRNTGSGATIGTHQNPTEHFSLGYDAKYKTIYHGANGSSSSGYDVERNVDKEFISSNKTGRSASLPNTYSGTGITAYSSRPTNTSVLYCIKYKPTYYVKMENNYGKFIDFSDQIQACNGVTITHKRGYIQNNIVSLQIVISTSKTGGLIFASIPKEYAPKYNINGASYPTEKPEDFGKITYAIIYERAEIYCYINKALSGAYIFQFTYPLNN